jgi:hypothetical protein
MATHHVDTEALDQTATSHVGDDGVPACAPVNPASTTQPTTHVSDDGTPAFLPGPVSPEVTGTHF